MSFLAHENAGGGGRRRVSQASSDEWRAALQQQIDEKKQREEQQKRYRRYEDGCVDAADARTRSHSNDRHASNSSNNNNSGDDDDADAHGSSGTTDPTLRTGRRGVLHMSNAAWRDALEQQIREKKEREAHPSTGSGAARRHSLSAPGEPPSASEVGFPEPRERATTTPAVHSGADASAPPPALGRRRASVQSDEEFARSLQEQREVQQRFEQEALELKRAMRRQRRKLLDDDAGDDGHAPQQQPAPSSSSSLSDRGGASRPKSEAASTSSETSNQLEREQEMPRATDPPEPVAPPAADPAALAKIVDFCEELKKQNEEVKQQLVEQRSVLASLRSSLAAAAPPTDEKQAPAAAAAKPSAKGSKLTEAPHRKCAAPAEAKTTRSSERVERKAEAPRAPVLRARPLRRGDSKIPSPGSSRAAVARAEPKETPAAAQPPPLSRSPLQKETPASPSLDATGEAEDREPSTEDRQSPLRRRSSAVDDSDEDDDAKRQLSGDDAKLPSDEHAVDAPREDSADDDDDERAEPEIGRTVSSLRAIDAKCLGGDGDAELPLGGDSAFVGCEDACGEEIASCSAFLLGDDARSSLVALDQSLDGLFERT